MIFHSYASDRGLSSHYWNDNSSFPRSRDGGGGLTSLHQPSPLSLSLPQCLPSTCGCRSPRDLFQMPPLWACIDENQPLPFRSLSLSPSLLPAAHCLVKETLPWLSRLPAYNPIKQWLSLLTCLLSLSKCQDYLREYVFVYTLILHRSFREVSWRL